MVKTKYIYIHLINGRPAYFDTFFQTIFLVHTYDRGCKPAFSLRQIKNEQLLNKQNSPKSSVEYSYIKYDIQKRKG